MLVNMAEIYAIRPSARAVPVSMVAHDQSITGWYSSEGMHGDCPRRFGTTARAVAGDSRGGCHTLDARKISPKALVRIKFCFLKM